MSISFLLQVYRFQSPSRLKTDWDNGRTLFVSSTGLENAKNLLSAYKQGQIKSMTPELWKAKKIVDSTLHPGKVHLYNMSSDRLERH